MGLIETAEDIMRLRIENEKLRQDMNQYKTERDSLIDDLAVLKANISRLERENEKQIDLLQDFSKFINYKLIVSPASDTYKHYRSELDKLGVK
ncbi:hypothetical protein [Staphylococcus caeli]|uniref:hypothetical protein n=1 Tax=Staphylococcus caeli TaxID=2201815 RepID=UPI003F57C2A4